MRCGDTFFHLDNCHPVGGGQGLSAEWRQLPDLLLKINFNIYLFMYLFNSPEV